MSLEALAWAWKQPLPCTQKMVLLALADCQNAETGQCNPRTKYLAEKCGLKHTSTEGALRALREGGLITIIHNYRDDGSLRNSDYLLHLTGHPTPSDGVPSPLTTGGTSFNGEQEPVIEPVIEPVTRNEHTLLSSSTIVPEDNNVCAPTGTSWADNIQWYEILKEIPEFKLSHDEAIAYTLDVDYDDAYLERTALELVSKWNPKKYKNPWATYRAWLKRGEATHRPTPDTTKPTYTPKPYDYNALKKYQASMPASLQDFLKGGEQDA